jgi:hypothetical protein
VDQGLVGFSIPLVIGIGVVLLLIIGATVMIEPNEPNGTRARKLLSRTEQPRTDFRKPTSRARVDALVRRRGLCS